MLEGAGAAHPRLELLDDNLYDGGGAGLQEAHPLDEVLVQEDVNLGGERGGELAAELGLQVERAVLAPQVGVVLLYAGHQLWGKAQLVHLQSD